MKALKLFLFVVVTTIIMAVSWAVGNAVGNILTSSTPPPPTNEAEAGMIFLAVCAFNSLLIAILLGTTSLYSGLKRRLAIVFYVFTIQSLLPQMETFFFGSQMGIGYDQAAAILIAGFVVSIITVWIATWLYAKLMKPAPFDTFRIPDLMKKEFLVWTGFSILIGYPFLYFTFGYFVAWQSEQVRIYYTGSAQMASYTDQLREIFGNGIYFFQIIRGLIWIAATLPIAVMLREQRAQQYLVVALLAALMPTSLLFIPNPYMPTNIAMVHFVETSTSNFVWGLLIVYVVNKGLPDLSPSRTPVS